MFNKVVLSLLLTSNAINYAMDERPDDINRKRPRGGDHQDEASAKRRIVIAAERLEMLAGAAAIAEDSGKYRRATMYLQGIAGLDLTQAARDDVAVRLLVESSTPDAKYFLAWMYRQGRAGLELDQLARDARAVELLTGLDIPEAKNNLAWMVLAR